MLRNGSYSAWYRTQLREGTGVVVFNEGQITGSDTVLAYTGTYLRCTTRLDPLRPRAVAAVERSRRQARRGPIGDTGWSALAPDRASRSVSCRSGPA